MSYSFSKVQCSAIFLTHLRRIVVILYDVIHANFITITGDVSPLDYGTGICFIPLLSCMVKRADGLLQFRGHLKTNFSMNLFFILMRFQQQVQNSRGRFT